jgi:hypothetical protein
MRVIAPIVLALTFAVGGDVGLYTYSMRERPREICAMGAEIERKRDKFEHEVLGWCGLLVNGGALACIFATLLRYVRNRHFPEDRMMA